MLITYVRGTIPQRCRWAATGPERRHGERTGVTWGYLLLEESGQAGGRLAHGHTSLLQKHGGGPRRWGGLYPSALCLLFPTGQSSSSGSYFLTPAHPSICPLADCRKPGPGPSSVAWFSN